MEEAGEEACCLSHWRFMKQFTADLLKLPAVPSICLSMLKLILACTRRAANPAMRSHI